MMRTSRVSRDTARLFDQAAAAGSTPRRTTRSLSRFAYAPISGNARATPDIEDAISPPAKRRRKLSAESPATARFSGLILSSPCQPRRPTEELPRHHLQRQETRALEQGYM
ncbi:hypothetical protein NLG97_g1494 [Lecanicillium saksenae]|uniref:Uncharacterized protein n=1 Tax=Lecanicillium saksenae TaxID=468837 RepID=A0ACC1R3T9_9HYPO|nr:hypothetical protein NLG97_g1494 [Lecanicillium saksenae]